MYIVVLYSKQEKVISEKLVSKKRLLFSCEVVFHPSRVLLDIVFPV